MQNCNKITFSSSEEARSYIKSIGNTKRESGSKKLKPYLCDECDEWHLTTQRKSKIFKKQRANINRLNTWQTEQQIN